MLPQEVKLVPSKQSSSQVNFEHWIQGVSLQTTLQLLAVPKTQSSQHGDTLIMIPVKTKNVHFSILTTVFLMYRK